MALIKGSSGAPIMTPVLPVSMEKLKLLLCMLPCTFGVEFALKGCMYGRNIELLYVERSLGSVACKIVRARLAREIHVRRGIIDAIIST